MLFSIRLASLAAANSWNFKLIFSRIFFCSDPIWPASILKDWIENGAVLIFIQAIFSHIAPDLFVVVSFFFVCFISDPSNCLQQKTTENISLNARCNFSLTAHVYAIAKWSIIYVCCTIRDASLIKLWQCIS